MRGEEKCRKEKERGGEGRTLSIIKKKDSPGQERSKRGQSVAQTELGNYLGQSIHKKRKEK